MISKLMAHVMFNGLLLLSFVGNVFIWGRYTNTYVAADATGNVALCDFDIFVQGSKLFCQD